MKMVMDNYVNYVYNYMYTNIFEENLDIFIGETTGYCSASILVIRLKQTNTVLEDIVCRI